MRLAEVGVARLVLMFSPEKADTVLSICDQWTTIIAARQRVGWR
jgi:hypothetical protein